MENVKKWWKIKKRNNEIIKPCNILFVEMSVHRNISIHPYIHVSALMVKFVYLFDLCSQKFRTGLIWAYAQEEVEERG